MKFAQYGFISFGGMTLVIGGVALAGLLAYGWTTGQELPVGPAIAVALVNLYAAVRLVIDKRKARQAPAPAADPAAPAPTRKKKRGGK